MVFRFFRKHLALRRISREAPFNLASLDADLRADEEVVLRALPKFPWNYQHAAAELRSNRMFVLKALQCCPAALRYVSESDRSDKELVMSAVGRSPQVLVHAANELKDDKDVILLAIQSEIRQAPGAVESLAYALASERLKRDPQVRSAAQEYAAHSKMVAECLAQR